MTAAALKILHVITGLGQGGAEVSLHNLLSALEREQYDFQVVSLSSEGSLAGRIQALGVPVTALNMQAAMPDPRLILRLARIIRRERPDLIQTWMYHADLVGGIASRMAGSPPVVWTLVHSPASLREFKPATRWVVRASAWLSHFLPQRIVCNANAGRERHIKLGYDVSKLQVIPFGFDLNVFRPDPDARRSVRDELGLADGVFLIGLCARFHPDKDHRNFVRAAGILHRELPAVHFLLWGTQVDEKNEILGGWLRENGLLESVHLLGHRTDLARLMASLDLSTISSATEAFPNVVGEAMAAGVPCVVTDVGDAGWIVGETGRTVPPGNPDFLAAAWSELLRLPSEERKQLGMQARRRVEAHFNRDKMTLEYGHLYRDIIAKERSRNA